jgi:hypothetical protein
MIEMCAAHSALVGYSASLVPLSLIDSLVGIYQYNPVVNNPFQ